MKRLDLTGMKFTRWTVLGPAPDVVDPSGYVRTMWYCKCDCGNPEIKTVSTKNLRKGNSKSCGCYAIEQIKKAHHKTNEYDLSGEYGIGYDQNGKVFMFDLEDYEKIKDYRWFTTQGGYLVSWTFKAQNGTKVPEHLHRLVMDFKEDHRVLVIDHINGNKRDNRKANLRVANRTQNCTNAKPRKNNTSGVTGVHFHKRSEKWVATININKKRKELGEFKNKEDAIAKRKEAERMYYGEYAFSERDSTQ